MLPAPRPTPRTTAEYRAWWSENTGVPYGLCWCGCGDRTTIATRTQADRGWVEGEPIRHVRGHQAKSTTAAQDAEICRRYQAGEKSVHIADFFGIDVGTIRRILDRNGVPLAGKDGPSRSLSPE